MIPVVGSGSLSAWQKYGTATSSSAASSSDSMEIDAEQPQRKRKAQDILSSSNGKKEKLDIPQEQRLLERGLFPIVLDFSSKNLTDDEVERDVIPLLLRFERDISLNLSRNDITAYGARLLAGVGHLRCLDISLNPIRDKGAMVLAGSTTLKELTANFCEIGDKGAWAFLENDSLEELWLLGNNIINSPEWSRQVSQRLESNKARNNPAYRSELEAKRVRAEQEKEVMKAIEEGRSEDLRTLVSRLERGVSSRLEYGCSLLMYAIDKHSLTCAKALLKMGARLEEHEREYTPLFTAAERGQLELVQLLLKYGANITGEFYFNMESSLSIAAFKFCEAFQDFLIRNIDQYPLSLKKPLQGMLNWWSQLWEMPFAPWKCFAEEDPLEYAKDCLQFFNIDKKQNPHDFNNIDLARLAEVFSVILGKYNIIKEKAPSSELDGYATDEDEDLELVHRIEPIVTPSEQSDRLTREQLKGYVDRLNQELQQGKKESDIDWSRYPRFFIAQYRGVHYFRHYFSKGQRADHRSTAHLNRIAPAPAAYFMSGLTPTAHQLTRESTIAHHRRVIGAAFEELRGSGPTKQYWGSKGKGVTFNNASDMLQQRMSNSYKSYMKDIATPQNPTTQYLYDRGVSQGYPHYATSDLPMHALKYAFGQKKIDGLTEYRLRPVFQENGKALHPYPGKLFMTMFTPLQMHEHRTRHAAGMHNQKQGFLKGTVAPERETDMPGGVDADTSFYEELVVIPSFEEYREDYQARYGITLEAFQQYKRDIALSWTLPEEAARTELRKKVKNKLIEGIIEHKEKQLLKMALEEAERRGGYLIFRHNDGVYGIEFEKMRIPSRGAPSYTKRENGIRDQFLGASRSLAIEESPP
jgi:hypothetical protein